MKREIMKQSVDISNLTILIKATFIANLGVEFIANCLPFEVTPTPILT